MSLEEKFISLKDQLEGEVNLDNLHLTIYATDASVYRERPLAVCFPKNENDLEKLVLFAHENKLPLIPRTAGTSLAGQVVGYGIIVDMSKHMTSVLEVNQKEKWVIVQPGVVRDELNTYLKQYGLYYGPETSTSNRAMIGGMIGNNSCGANSIVYGSARDNLYEINGFLSNGEKVSFTSLNFDQFKEKTHQSTLEGSIYKDVYELLKPKHVRDQIQEQFPKPTIERRNTGYAIDLLAKMEPFTSEGEKFDFCQLLAGSEGTLMLSSSYKLKLNDLPPKYKGVVCAHFNSIDEALKANLVGLKSEPVRSELIDHYILECTKASREQTKNRFFVQGDPQAILVIELQKHSEFELEEALEKLVADLKIAGFGYHFPKVYNDDINKVWSLRKAGLGLLSNIPGDAKPVAVIEDTAVDVEDLPSFIADFNKTLEKYNMSCVHYAHAGSGELHLRPILNLKDEKDVKMFKIIATDIAELVKKYKGSLSGEHGDGRLRGEFIPFMIGEENYKLIEKVKKSWDPHNIFNPKKIVDTPSMNSSLRYETNDEEKSFNHYFDWSEDEGFLKAIEKCNGSGDCRKSSATGGVMCPSYMATKNEKDTTRARANILREYFTDKKKSIFDVDLEEANDILKLCLSCKGCKLECPSNVDMASIKAEFMAYYQQVKGVSFASKMMANIAKMNRLASLTPGLSNFVLKNKFTSKILKKKLNIAPERDLPLYASQTLEKWFFTRRKKKINVKKEVYFFIDEFTNFNDVEIGKKAILLLEKLGVKISFLPHLESGRTFISKGFLIEAKEISEKNIRIFSDIITKEVPLIGLEPSAILTFRDEYISLNTGELKEEAKQLAKNVFTIEEYLVQLIDEELLSSDLFTIKADCEVLIHGHCYQKALSSVLYTEKILNVLPYAEIKTIPSGCCGMAGSFGYDKDNYKTSMAIGEMELFPAIRAKSNCEVSAAGTSCRHQIKDGVAKEAKHPVEILYNRLK